jgi:hypothetical protein
MLNSSGPISLRDIKREFRSSSADSGISLSTYYAGGAFVPLGGGIPSNGTLSLSDFYGKDLKYAFVENGSQGPTINLIVVSESTENVYLLFQGNSIAKFHSDGVMQWRRNLLSGSNLNEISTIQDMKIDSAENVYVAGSIRDSSFSVPVVIKYNSSGVMQWQRKSFPGTGASTNQIGSLFYSLAITNTDEIICTTNAPTSGGTNYASTVLKFNSSGTLLWKTRLQFSSFSSDARSPVVDSSGNIYFVARLGTGLINLVKLNSSGVLQWQIPYERSNETPVPSGTNNFWEVDELKLKIGSDGSLYGSVDYGNAEFGNPWAQVIIVKWNSSGVEQWRRKLLVPEPNSGRGVVSTDMEIDSTNDIYIAGNYGLPNTAFGAFRNGFVAKWNSSGVLQWQRQIYSGNQEKITQIAVNSIYGAMYMKHLTLVPGSLTTVYGGGYDWTDKNVMLRLPSNGAGASGAKPVFNGGVTNNQIYYLASTLTESAAVALRTSTRNLVASAPLTTESASSATDSAGGSISYLMNRFS